MRHSLLSALFLCLASCSSSEGTQGNVVANTVPAAMPTAAAGATATANAAGDRGATPKPGVTRTFRDWIVACDNVRRCAMASLAPEDGSAADMSMEVARDAGPGGGYAISIGSYDDSGPTPAVLMIDGTRFAVAGNGLAGEAAARIATALANAKRLSIVDGKGATLATLSAAGASASLRYIDAAQGRAGGVTATVAKGSAPASGVPAAPVAPVVSALAPGGSAATPSAVQLATMKKLGECEDAPTPGADWSPASHALGGGKTLVVLPCSAGAYNVIGALFVIDGATVTPVDIDAPAGFDETGADSQTPVHSVVNGDWDAGLLTSYAKGRGLGDCGVNQSFAWDGRRLRLIEQSEMGECRGNPHFLRTWTAKVERR